MSKDLKSGSPAPASGQYGVYGVRNGYKGEITSTKGNTLPPTGQAGWSFRLVDGTKNASGKVK